MDPIVKMRNPNLYSFTLPKISENRPIVTRTTAVTSAYPTIVQRRYGKFEESPGLICSPLKISGKEINTMVISIDAINDPKDVLDKTVHLYAIDI